MQVVVIPDHRAPVVTHMVWYKVGSADEAPRKSGLAHFLEHLMFKGTSEVPDGQFSYIVARNGGSENAFTTYDNTAYYQSVARDRLELVMELEADRMTNLILSEADVETERQVILEERRMRVDNDPAAILGEQVRAAQFFIHPYGWPVIGWEHEIETLTHQDVIDFYKQHYAPNNAVLVVAGDITAEELRPLAEKYYGAIAATDVPERLRPQEPPQQAARRVVREDARAAQPSISITYLAPSYNQDGGDVAFALDALAEVLAGSTTSRLYRELVVEQGVAVSAGAWYNGDNLDDGRFGFWIVPAMDVAVEDAEAAMRAEIDRLLADGVTEAELERVKQRIRANLIYARDSVAGIARWYGSMLTTGLTTDDIEAWPDRIEAVTVDQINAAARQVLVDDTSVTGVLLPQAPEQES
jgi:zinc protease